MSVTLVTGASGFVGLPSVAHLVGVGEEVHAISTRPSPPSVAGVSWHLLDIGDTHALEALIAEVQPERLLHLAWYVEHGKFWSAPENVVWVERTLALLRAFIAGGGRRVVMVGTCAEYDWSQASQPLREDSSPIAPGTLYGVAKDSLHRLAAAYAAQAGVELAWARLFFLYGPREAPDRLVAAVIRSLLAGTPVETTLGTQTRDFLHVEDVAGALAAMLTSPLVGPVNVGSGNAVSIAEVLDRIAVEIARPELILRGAIPDRPLDPPMLVADVARLRETGFRPRLDLDHGLRDAIDWWRGAPRGSA